MSLLKEVYEKYIEKIKVLFKLMYKIEKIVNNFFRIFKKGKKG